MAYSATYSFASQSGSDTGWDYWNTDAGDHSVQAENTDQYWCWTDSGSTSSSTGPPSGTDCVYTETSSPTAVGDVYTMTLTDDIDASIYDLNDVSFDVCKQGDSAGTIYFEAYDGTTWNEIDSWAGDSVTTFASQSYDFGPNDLDYDNTDFNLRFRVVVGGTTYHNDFAIANVSISGDDKVTDPEITNCGDEDHYIGETGITITGTTFETDGTDSRVRIDSSSAGTGTSQTQTDTSWADTSINFTASLGSLDYGTNYLFVRNDTGNENSVGYEINLFQNLTTTSLNDTTIYNGQTSIELNGSGFGSSQGSSKLYLCDSSDGSGTNVEQTVTTWASGKVTFTAVAGTLSLGTVYAIVGRNSSSLGDDAERLSPSQTATLGATPTIPEITDIEDESIVVGETGILMDGTGFESSQGTGKIELCPTSTYASAVEQTVATWGNTQIEFTAVQGALSLGTVYMFVTNDSGYRSTTGYAVTLLEAASDEGLYIESSFQTTVTSTGLTTTAFLISDEG